MKKIVKINSFIIMLCSFLMMGCSDFLEINPKGVLSGALLEGAENVEGFVTAAYSFSPQQDVYASLNSWQHGSMRSDDAYKGGGGLSDQTPWHQIELFTPVTANVGNNNNVWVAGFRALSRINDAIRMLDKLELSEFPNRDIRKGEMLFLRGYHLYKLKLIYKYIPYVDDSMPQEVEYFEQLPNRTDRKSTRLNSSH